MYTKEKLTVLDRCTIQVNSVVEIPVSEDIVLQCNNYATIHIRKKFAKQGLLQLVTTPLPEGVWKPLIVVQNNGVSPIELRAGDEIASVWVYQFN